MTGKLTVLRLLAVASLLLLSGPSGAFGADEPNPENPPSISYYKDIRPIFQARCHGCHQPARAKGNYIMTRFEQLLAGGAGGDAAIVAGDPDASLLMELITPIDGEFEMPRKGDALSATEIDLIGRWIAAGAWDDTPVKALQKVDSAHPPSYDSPPMITALAYSSDGRYLAVSGYHEVLIHDLAESSIAARLIGLSARIESICFSPDGKKLAVTGGLPARMGEVQVWDTEKWQLKLSVPVTFDTVYGASWSPDSKLIAFGCGDSTLRAIDAGSGEQVLFSRASSDWTLDTIFSGDGNYLISVGRDMTAKLTEVETQRFVDNITSITPAILKGGLAALARHPDKDEVLVGGADGTPQIYRVHREVKRVIGDNSNLLRSFPPMPGRIFDLGYRSDGKRIAAGSSLDGSGHLHIYSSDFDGTLPKGMKGILEKVSTSRSAAEKKRIAEFHSKNIAVVASAEFSTPIYALCWHPNQLELAIAGADGLIRILDGDDASVKRVVMSVPMAEENSDDVVAITIDPPRVKIAEKFGTQQLIVTGWLASGHPVDLTNKASYSPSSDMIKVSAGRVEPVEDGEGQLVIAHGDHTVEIPFAVAGKDDDFQPNFIRDVNPVISKLGCNSGSCHGSKDGKNGFKLSLRGYDPILDVRSFADDHAGRRVNFAAPDDSLMLLKATGSVPHEGNQRTPPDSADYQLLRAWIAGGCQLETAVARVERIEIFPENPVVQKIGDEQQLRVTAFYEDGASRDVTALSFVTSGDIEIATCSEEALVTTLRRGEAPLLARYEGAYAATTLTVMGDRSGFEWLDPPINNSIDQLVANKWKRLKILPSELCSDTEFLRRITLDLTGLPPTPEKVLSFIADERDSKTKRDEVIDQLIGSEDFVIYWANRWADLLQVNGKFLGKEGSASFRKWIHEEVAANRPYDEFAYDILTASGSTMDHPPASYFKILRKPAETMENTTQLFLATRFNCNKCHDHPFERWTQDQYYELAAYFAQVGLKDDSRSGKSRIGGTAVEGSKALYEIVSDLDKGELKHDRTGEIAAPAFPYDASHTATEGQTRREQLASWMTSPDNRYFARSYANRIWGYLLGVGLIDPLDDIRAGNPPSNPELLDWLTAEFVAADFNVQKLIATICKSRTYQLSFHPNRWNQDDQINFSRANPRRLPAEVLYDSIHLALGARMRIPGVPEGTRASALPDVGIKLQDGFLTTLGRPARESACECERSGDLGLGSVMALVTGPTVDKAISDASNAITALVEAQPDDGKLVEELYLRILSRPATPEEVKGVLAVLAEIDQDHHALLAEYDAYQGEAKLLAENRESQRQQDISEAKIEVAAYEEEIAPREAQLDLLQTQAIEKATAEEAAYTKTLPEKLLGWEKLQEGVTRWIPLVPENLQASNGATLTLEEDGAVFVSGSKGIGSYTFSSQSDTEKVTAIRIEALADKRLPNGGPGRANSNGNFVLSEFEVEWSPAPDGEIPAKRTRLALLNPKADFSQQNYSVAGTIDGKIDRTGWATSPRFAEDRYATYELKESIGGEGSSLFFTMHHNYDADHAIGKFRVWITTSPTPVDFGIPLAITTILDTPEETRTEEQKSELLTYFGNSDPELKKHRKRIADAKMERPTDPQLLQLRNKVARVEKPLPKNPKLLRYERAKKLSEEQLKNRRVTAIHDVAWALINSPAFLFNH